MLMGVTENCRFTCSNSCEPNCALTFHYAMMQMIQYLISPVANHSCTKCFSTTVKSLSTVRHLLQSSKLFLVQVKKSILPSFSNHSLPFLDDNAKEMVHKKGGQWSPLINYRNGLARQGEDEEGRCSIIIFRLSFPFFHCLQMSSPTIDCNGLWLSNSPCSNQVDIQTIIVSCYSGSKMNEGKKLRF